MFKVIHSLPCTPHVFPCPDTGLTYIRRAGWDGAMQMAVKPDQLAAGGLKAHQDSACPSPDRGFHALHHILAIHLLFLFHNNLTPRSWKFFYRTKRKKVIASVSAMFCFFFVPCFSWRRKTWAILKIAHRTEQLCYITDECTFLKHNSHPFRLAVYLSVFRNKDLVLIWVWSAGCERESITGRSVPGESCCLLLLPAACWLCHTLQLPHSKALCFT